MAGVILMWPKVFALASTGKVVGDKYNLPYPRIGFLMWAGTSEWFGQKGIDLVVGWYDIGTVKRMNPKILVGRTTDILAGAGVCKEEWYVKDANDKDMNVEIYAGMPLCDVTNSQYQDAVANAFANLANGLDFIMTDGLRTPKYVAKGTTPQKIVDGFPTAYHNILDKINKKTGNKPFIVNGDNCYGSDQDLYNGSYIEYGGPFLSTWSGGFGGLTRCADNNRQPQLTILDGHIGWGEGLPGGDNEFKVMRFVLGTALTSNIFFSFQRPGVDNNHFYIGYFDEYDLDLGYPTTGVLSQVCKGASWLYQCLYVRFFDKGVMILNATGEEETITDSDLKKYTNYKGPYYRFRGGQDPNWNNGQLFSNTTLAGAKIKTSTEYEHYKIFGDSLILLNKPQTVVADIIIDENTKTTSPGSSETELNGSWQKTKDEAGFWNLYHSNVGVEATYYAYSQAKNSTAIFRPTIGVAGRYRVYEWHGDSKAGSETNSAVYEIYGSNGTKNSTINQSTNYNKWNYLGEVYLAAGTNNYVKLSNNGDGVLIADAVKFEYQQAQLKADFNCDGAVNVIDFGILLSHWNQTANLEKYKHTQCAESKTLDLMVDKKVDALDLSKLLACWGSPGKDVCYE